MGFFAMRTISTHIPIAAGAGVLALLATADAARAGAACRPTAVVVGAAEIVTPIAAALRRRGVGAGPSECGRVVHASLAARPNLDTYSLHIEDGYGRVSDREVADAGTAASLIESWVIDEDADVLAPRAAPAAIETVTAAAVPPVAPPAATWRMDALGELATATDGSRWYGGTLAACGRIGPICVGGRIRIARDTRDDGVVDFGAGGIGGDFTGSLSRTRYGGAAIVSLPLSRGRFTLAPTIGLGLVQTRSVLSAAPIELADQVLSASAEAGIAVAGALSAHWSVVADLGGALAYPFSSDNNDEAPWDFAPSPPRGLLTLGLGVRHAR
jgi:hypothetical protein